MILLFLNGQLEGNWWQSLIERATLLVGVDGGSRYLLDKGYQPDLIVGDLDSLAVEQKILEGRGVEIKRYPREKDETDLELALIHLFDERGVNEPVYLLGGMGGRTDQMLGNLLILLHPRFRQRKLVFLQEKEQIWLLEKGKHEIVGEVGVTVSLLPLAGDVFVTRTDGLQWALCEEWVYMGIPRGISNCVTKRIWQIEIEEGKMLLVYSSGFGTGII